MFLRKDATIHQVIRVDERIRKTTIYAKIAFIIEGPVQKGNWSFAMFKNDNGSLDICVIIELNFGRE